MVWFRGLEWEEWPARCGILMKGGCGLIVGYDTMYTYERDGDLDIQGLSRPLQATAGVSGVGGNETELRQASARRYKTRTGESQR